MIFILICVLLFSTPVLANNDEFLAYLTDFQLWVNAEQKTTQNPVMVIDDYTYLPVREVSNLLGYNVEWDEASKSVHIDTPSVEYDKYTAFEEDGSWGYKDSFGSTVIEPQYEYAGDFCEGIAIVQFKDYKYGFINMSGNCIYKGNIMPTKFKEGFALASNYVDDLPDIGTDDGAIIVRSDREQEYFFIDKSGNIISEKYPDARLFSEGMAVVQVEGTNNPFQHDSEKLYSYIDKRGRLATDLKFNKAESFENGYAKVTTVDGQSGKIDKLFNFYQD